MDNNSAPVFKRDNSENLSNLYWAIATRQLFGAVSAVEVFNTSISIKSLVEHPDLRLVDELEGEKRWGMHRIIQRNITYNRVEDISTGFLGSRNKDVKYFPGITVALLPFDSQGPRQAYQSGGGYKGVEGFSVFVPGTNEQTDEDSNSWEGWDFPYQVQWDRNKILAVVIDGQHRVKALRTSYSAASLTDVLAESIPASLVLLRDTDPIKATRQIFIDVNNTPKTVSEQRLILIDDRHIIRRMTANAVGASILDEDNDDPYVKFRDLNYVDPSLLQGKINNLYVAGQTSDDSSMESLYFSHEGLFPWEVTHILTLHEYINKKIMFSNGEKDNEIGTGPDFATLAFHVNSALTRNIQSSAQSSNDPVEELERSEQSIRENDRISGAAKAVLSRLVNIYSAFASAVNEEDEDESKTVQFALKEALRAPENFNFDSDHVAYLLENELMDISAFANHLFTHLDAYKEIDRLVTDDSNVPKTVKFRLIETLRDCRGSISKDHCNSPQRLLRAFVSAEEGEELSPEVQKGISAWLESLIEVNKKTGLLRYLVVQQGVFLWAVRVAGAAGANPFGASSAELAAGRINMMRSANFFIKEGHVCLSGLFDGKVSISCLEGTVLHASTIRTGRVSAMRLAELLILVDKGVRSRDDANRCVAPAGFRAGTVYRKLIRSIGRAVLDIVSNDGYSMTYVREQLLNVSSKLELTEPEGVQFTTSWDVQTEVKQKELLQRGLGSIAYKAIVDKYVGR